MNAMKWLKRLRTTHMLFPWMFSYLLVLAIPLGAYSLTIVFTTRALEQDIQENNSVLIGQMAQAYDNTLKGALQFRDYLWQDQSLTDLLPLRFPLTTQARYDLWQASLNFYNQMGQNALIQDGYIYLHQSKTALCKKSIYDTALLWRILHADMGDLLEQDDWFRALTEYHFSDYYLIPNESGNCRVAILSSIPFMNIYQTAATIVLILDEKAFPSYAGQGGMDDVSLLVIGRKGELISTSNPALTAYLPLLNEGIAAAGAANGSFEIYLDGIRSLVTVRPSGLAQWNYVSVTPLKTLLQKITRLSGWMVLCVAVSGVTALLLAVWLARRNRTAIDAVLRKLHSLSKETVALNGKGSFDQIDGMLDSITRHSDRMDIMVERQKEMLQRHALERLLFSGAQSDRILQEIGIEFRHPSFITAACFFNENLDTNMSGEKLEALLLENAGRLAAQWKSFADIRLLPVNGMIVLLLNAPTGVLNQALEEKMTRQIRLVQQAQMEQHRYFFVSISSEHTGLLEICDAYYESIAWVNYSLIDRPREFSVYFCHPSVESEVSLAVTPIQEEMILSVLSSGNEEAAQRLVEQLCLPFHRAPVSPPLARCYFHTIISVMVREISTAGVRELVEDDLVVMETCTGIKDMQNTLLRVTLRLARYYRNLEEQEKGGTLLEEMLALMRTHYADCEFNASTMAGMMDRSLSYISKYFKDKTGVGLYDYLNRMRIEKAKELIAGSNRPISSLIDQAGFQNLGSFIRVFKRYENMTPGAYQKKQNPEG